MSRLECTKCKSVFSDVEHIRRCPLCSNTNFIDAEPLIRIFPWQRIGFDGNIGFYYTKGVRLDSAASLDEN